MRAKRAKSHRQETQRRGDPNHADIMPRKRSLSAARSIDNDPNMTRRIKRIAPLQAGKMAGVLYACFGLIFLPIFALAGVAGAFAQQVQQTQTANAPSAALMAAMMFGFGIFMPVFYGIFGFVFGIISAAIYNQIARWIGGIEVEVE